MDIKALCPVCGERKVKVEVEGRVLLCEVCADDPAIKKEAKEWR